jgi:hypothetical protein
VLGEKVRIGKYKPKKGYKRHAGHRSRLSQIEIESIGKKATRSAKAKEKAEPAAEETTAPAEKKPRASRAKKEES